MWPTTATVGPPAVPATRANEEPTRSPPTSWANREQYSRHTCAGRDSWPEGPGAVRSFVSSSGIGMSTKAIG